jgi:hypothetical protein
VGAVKAGGGSTANVLELEAAGTAGDWNISSATAAVAIEDDEEEGEEAEGVSEVVVRVS